VETRYTRPPRLTLTHTTVLERAGRRCECTGAGCHGAQRRCPRALPTHILHVAPADPSCPPATASRLPASDMRAWCARCWELAARQARAQRRAEGWQRLPIDTGDTGSTSIRLVIGILVALAAAGCLAARPHPVVAGLVAVLAVAGLVAVTVATWRARESEHRAHLLYLDGDRDRLVAEIDDRDVTIADLHVELDDARAELADAQGAQTSAPVDDPGPYFRFSWPEPVAATEPQDDDARREGAIQLYRQCRELIDLVTCQRSALGEATAEIIRLRQESYAGGIDVRRIVAVAAECRRLLDDEQTDRQALLERLLEAIDEATGDLPGSAS
jgi:hypothetical protein